jgi:hypothetical protein
VPCKRLLRDEVKSDSESNRFVIATCSLQHLDEVGLRFAAPEKRADKNQSLPPWSVLCSPIPRPRIAENGHDSRFSLKIEAGILCSTDCVAEREGFEPSVQF